MSAFLAGALGALTVLLAAALLRRLVRRRFHGGHGRGRPLFLSRLARRLGARPEQERVLSAEAEALVTELRSLRSGAVALRAELADLLVAPTLDAARARQVLEARLAAVEGLKGRLAEALARVHATLEPAQRARLAALVRHGHGHGRRAAHP